MSPIVRLFRARLERRANALAPDVRAAMLRAFEQMRKAQSEAELARRIVEGQLDQLLTAQDVDLALATVKRVVRDGVEDAAKAATRDLPKSIQAPFDVLNPKVIEAIRQLNDRALNDVREDVRDVVRAYVEDGLRGGMAPRTLAREMRDLIGLGPVQYEQAAAFRAKLIADGITEARADKMLAAYIKRRIAQNAEAVTRSIAMDAQKLGQHLTMEAAIDRGDIDGGTLFKRWSAVAGPQGDGRNRPEHLAMHGETVKWDEYFSNGQFIPGESDYNCRCLPIYFTDASGNARKAGRGWQGLAA